jgi:hypothetical protein
VAVVQPVIQLITAYIYTYCSAVAWFQLPPAGMWLTTPHTQKHSKITPFHLIFLAHAIWK